MKNIAYLFFVSILLLSQACMKRDIIDSKEGISLPAVNNLTMQELANNEVQLTWEMPSIPEGIEQPVKVFIEVREVISVTRTITIATTTLEGAPTQFSYVIPDPAKTYHLTVKLNASTVRRDVNYASNIYSLGQTVVFDK